MRFVPLAGEALGSGYALSRLADLAVDADAKVYASEVAINWFEELKRLVPTDE